jgi:hypothetical protein
LAAFHDGDTRIGGTEINADDFAHDGLKSLRTELETGAASKGGPFSPEPLSKFSGCLSSFG